MTSSYLPYEEPSAAVILIQASFIVLLNVVNYVLDRAVYCGLVGQIFLGVAWGQPGAKWLVDDVQDVMGQLGYLGLILVVYEGGLTISLPALRANLLLSICVAVTGIGIPIALSFVMVPLVDATKLQAFAAGAALCSTSLGTTFTILGTSGLSSSKLGVVLTSAAMLDDVVGLIMVQVISNLGSTNLEPITVLRPIIVAIGLVLFLLLICRFAIKPTVEIASRSLETWTALKGRMQRMGKQVKLVLQSLVLFGLVAGASYAGTSNLFAAYLAGVLVSWMDGLIPVTNGSGMQLYQEYFGSAVQRILKPFFFASIGFAIPISDMFEGRIIWRGLIYTILMAFGKLACGTWLLPWPKAFSWTGAKKHIAESQVGQTASRKQSSERRAKTRNMQGAIASNSVEHDQELKTLPESSLRKPNPSSPSDDAAEPSARAKGNRRQSQKQNITAKRDPHVPKTRSLYPSAMLGSAMIARGEIGFLISSLAESHGIFSNSSTVSSSDSSTTAKRPSQLYLIVTWAIMLCTILGPVYLGLLVKRVKRLRNQERKGAEGRGDPLGIWGA